jgi:DNA-binding LacI/PurR family transcriptional regulator
MTIKKAVKDFVQTMRRQNVDGFVTAGIGVNNTIIAYFEPNKMPSVEIWFVDNFKVIPKPMSRPKTL